MSSLSPQSFTAITDLFHRISGIRLTEAKRALVQSRLQKLAADSGESDLNVFVQKMVRGQLSEDMLVSVVDKLTTNETYFFREPAHFEDLARRAGAHRATGGAGGAGEFLVWSGASSSGEEAYSIAMVLADKLGTAPWTIHGTDLSTTVVDSARQGLYPMERARDTSKDYLRRFCLRGEGPYEGQLLIMKELRARVKFQCANLMQPLPALPLFDVIFLRNVLIYFDASAKRAIVERVIERLKPGGVLYPGHAESLAALDLPLKAIAPAIYQHA
ncbi:chemotaxis protein methyltransferase CheR [Paucibacter oligotrophus]|uniref:Chemotaxis protein methyltransferase n=1 Tax=Roseateles oligotrophus TaxID=1769250 RepID=A0A840L9F7_9BURK|nr:CheR family methyltransferase [Roseateles oligotrophus]MBB4844800.1 chemotaxis protein methyltransferase CheR [Roseateles oligotrophus]